MSKYHRIKDFLADRHQEYVPMTFAEIEKIIEFPLPASKQYPAWWSNNASNNPMTKEWLDAGYETQSVNIAGEKLVFKRVKKSENEMKQAGFGEAPQAAFGEAPAKPKHPGFGFMKGLLTIEPGYDLTTPSSELWFEGFVRKTDRNG